MAAIDYPDYLRLTGLYRGLSYPEYIPHAGEKVKVFINTFPPASPLTAGAEVKLIDLETNLSTPYVSPAGYYVRYAEWMGTFTERVQLYNTLDDFPPFIISLPAAMDTHEYEKIPFFDTRYFDPKAERDHTWDFYVKNVSDFDAVGSVQVALLVTVKGSKKMTSKRVKCPLCGHIDEVPLKVTRIECSKCRRAYVVMFFGGDFV